MTYTPSGEEISDDEGGRARRIVSAGIILVRLLS